MISYNEFLASRAQQNIGHGFEPDDLPSHLFDLQRLLVDQERAWAARSPYFEEDS